MSFFAIQQNYIHFYSLKSEPKQFILSKVYFLLKQRYRDFFITRDRFETDIIRYYLLQTLHR